MLSGATAAVQGVRLVTASGNTVRLHDLKGLHLILVVGDNDASKWWFNALTHHRQPFLRHFMTDRDLQTMAPRLHIRPTVLPALVVTMDGWFVDWFPAEAPPSGRPISGDAIVAAVRPYLPVYL